ncbi:low molecular weight protein-tyrosine-phosphatase [Albimonas pacifica]|uniref:Protein tyrosine phosphatase n=1 Tax=Albimonas pacifica TaxID=1114924 RepID=A0A1I3FAD0_9RHOB|nr:low molecular weight protein-tyrosine-phosphatase [Albimonas pacifica]SFI07831.1 protein tyrosine phosphatase [Albimonas pacifica]
MTRLLFVCLGNICRSPAAEGVARAMAQARGLAVEIDSAGTGGWHAGDPPDPRMREAALRRGYDLSALRARQVRRADFAAFDHILAMDADNLAALERARPADARAALSLMLSHADLPEREVPDPYYGGPQGFDHVLDLLEAAVAGLLDRLEAQAR